MRVLVLDATQRAALAVTRSLARAGLEPVAADETALTLAGASRHAAGRLVYPSPRTAPERFLQWLDSAVAEHGIDAALPITEVTTDLMLRHRQRWAKLLLPFAPIESIDALSDKVRLYVRAAELAVPVPRSVIIRNREDVERATAEIGFPAVLKPHRSRIWRGSYFAPTSVVRVSNLEDLQAQSAQDAFSDFPFLYQEQVRGHGQGIFALYWNGEAVAFFSHRRLREKPPEGGVSVLCESCAPDPTLLAAAKRLLDDAKWHGVAMVEFKVDENEGPYLMEINARFWGSLQLAIDAGVDFPSLLMDLATRGTARAPAKYSEGRRLRWFLGDLDRLYLLSRGIGRYGAAYVLREYADFLLPRPLTTRHEVFRWSDPWPAFRELRQYVAALGRG